MLVNSIIFIYTSYDNDIGQWCAVGQSKVVNQMKIIYETERLILKVFQTEDVDDTKSFWGSEEVMTYCLGAIPHESLTKVVASYANCHVEKGLSVYAVIDKQSGKLIGAAGFNITTSTETVELIYHFAKESWGKGFATEAATACVNIAKANGDVKMIYASAAPINAKSLTILEKVGFDYQGMKWFDDTKQEEPYYVMVI